MIAFLLACNQDAGRFGLCEPTEAPTVTVEPLGEAPWDPYVVELSGDGEVWEASAAVIAGADGVIETEALEIPNLLPLAAGLVRPVTERKAGEYVTVGGWATPIAATVRGETSNCPTLRPPAWTALDETTQVSDYGRDPAFDPESLADARFQITPGATFIGGDPGLADIIGRSLTLHLEILEVAEEAATFRLVSQIYGSTDECVLLQDTAALSSTGELTWARDRIEAETEPAPLTLYSPSIRLGFLGDRAAGGEVMTLADVRASIGADLDICDFAQSFGAGCQPCPDDGKPSCLAIAGFAWTATKVAESIEPDLPWCGVDFSDPDNVPEWTFDFSCETNGLCAASALGLALPFVWRRRRR